MAVDPWFSAWNFDFFRILFHYIPHRKFIDSWCDSLISTPPLIAWVFSFCFYRFWIKQDDQTQLRRSHLIRAVEAFAAATLLTLLLRPLVHWPAPILDARFRPLFPEYLWGNGSWNCFPSHSTLAYFTIGLGFWRVNRRLSIWLSIIVLAFISFPRIYQGGHYPVDVLFSCCLTILALGVVWHWPALADLESWITRRKIPRGMQELILFLWLLELGEGFRSAEFLAGLVHRATARSLITGLIG